MSRFHRRPSPSAEPSRSDESSSARRRRLVATAIALWLSAAALLYGLGPTHSPVLAEGQRAPATVVAALDFECLDLSAMDLLRRQFMDAVPPVFSIAAARRQEVLRGLGKLFDQVANLRERYRDDPERLAPALADVLDLLGLALTPEDALALAPEQHSAEALEVLRAAFRKIWNRGIVSSTDRDSRFQGAAPAGRILLETGEGDAPQTVEVRDLLTPAEAALAAAMAARAHPIYADIDTARLRQLWMTWMTPNLIYEPALTRQRREAAERSVPAVKRSVPAGTVLIEAGERATVQTVELLRAHDRRLRERTPPHEHTRRAAGRAGVLALFLLPLILALDRFHPPAFADRSRPILFFTLSLATLGAVRGLLHLTVLEQLLPPAVTDFAMPLSFAPLAATILAGGGLTLAVGAWVTAAAAVMAGGSFHVAITGTLATLVSILAARRVRRRAVVFRAGFWIALTALAYVLLTALTALPTAPLLMRQAVAVIVSAFASAAATLLVIPIFEEALGFTTDIRLLELSDPGHPLLQRLAVEAPGTYHHSLMVANLAQAAADEIGANGLLARVSACYHDIGKLTKPEFFIENAHPRRNPHDTLAPEASAAIIRAHVEDGVALARRYRLPAFIVDAIREHHGNSLIRYFYRRAQERKGSDPREEDFRYPGEPPHSRELAILAIADAVEAASRAVDPVTPEGLRKLVDDLVARKRDEGQFDHCGLTLDELRRVRERLTAVLINMHHARIPYPESHADSSGQSTAAVASPPSAADDTRGVGDGARPGGTA